jgi:hypothetical protein
MAKYVLSKMRITSKLDLGTSFAEIWKDPGPREELQRHLDGEMCSEIFWFFEAVEEFKNPQGNEREMLSVKEHAKIVCKRFIASR